MPPFCHSVIEVKNLSCTFQIPKWDGYTGTIEKIDDNRYLNSGEIAILDDDDDSVEITEIPIRVGTLAYKEYLEFLMTGVKSGDDKEKDKNKGKGKDKDKAKDKEKEKEEKLAKKIIK